jgi:hypothetical protein
VDQDTVGKVADATGELAKTADTALKLAGNFGGILKGYLGEKVGILEDRVKFARWERRLAFIDKASSIMRNRGIAAPSRELPLPFAVPLLNNAMLEEDDVLQETWARLIVNAGDASTEIELRTAYVDILRSMSAFDVKNLAVMAEASREFRGKVTIPILETWNLPNFVMAHDEASGAGEPLSEAVGISINNLNRLGCIASASSTFGGRPIFAFATVTGLGMALYKACS